MNLLNTTRRALLINTAKYAAIVGRFSPVAYWPLNEASGSVAADLSGNGYHGTYNGATLSSTPGAAPSMGRKPLFDAVNDCITMPPAFLADERYHNEGAISFWAKGPFTGTYTFLFHFSGGGSNGLYAQISSAASVSFYRYASTSKFVQYIHAGITGWIHFGARWSVTGDFLRFYANGVEVGTAASGVLAMGAGAFDAGATQIGALTNTAGVGSNVFDGWIGDFAVFASPLTASDMLTLATAV